MKTNENLEVSVHTVNTGGENKILKVSDLYMGLREDLAFRV